MDIDLMIAEYQVKKLSLQGLRVIGTQIDFGTTELWPLLKLKF